MGGGGEQKMSGYLGGGAPKPEALNTAMLGDISASYLKGPTQPNYVGLSDASKSQIGSMMDATGIYNAGLGEAVNYNRGLLSQGGLTDSQRGNMGLMNSLAQSSGAGNPHVEDIIKQTNDNTYADMMASLGSSGMAGSSIHMKELGGALADNESRLRYQDYNDAFGRQMGASQAAFNMGQTGTANASAAAGNAGTLYENAMMPYQQRLSAQSILDADQRAQAQFDPNYQHQLKYQGLLGGNAAGPQPEKKPGLFDWLGLLGGTAAAVL